MPTNDNTVQPVTSEQSPNKPRRKGGLWGIFSLCVLGLLIAGAAYVSYPYLQDYHNQWLTLQADIRDQQQQQRATQAALQTQQAQMAAQQQAFAEQQQAYQAQSAALQQAQAQLQQREAGLIQQLRQARHMVASSGTHWIVAEADYLLRMAQQHLKLTRDLATVRHLLQQADQRLRSTQNPDWDLVRTHIAQEIASLKSVELPDHVGISAQLNAMSSQVAQLRLPSHRTPQSSTAPATPEATTEQEATLLDNLWQGFQSMVQIRQHDQPIQAMIPPAQQGYLYEQVRQYLQLTGLAVLRSDNRLYQASLQQLITQLNQHFDPEDSRTRSLLTSLTDLTTIDLTPELPNIQQSLRTLHQQQQLSNLHNQTTNP